MPSTFHFVLCSLGVRSFVRWDPRRISFSKKHSMLWCRCRRSEEEERRGEEAVVVRLFDRSKTNFLYYGMEMKQCKLTTDTELQSGVRGGQWLQAAGIAKSQCEWETGGRVWGGRTGTNFARGPKSEFPRW